MSRELGKTKHEGNIADLQGDVRAARGVTHGRLSDFEPTDEPKLTPCAVPVSTSGQVLRRPMLSNLVHPDFCTDLPSSKDASSPPLLLGRNLSGDHSLQQRIIVAPILHRTAARVPPSLADVSPELAEYPPSTSCIERQEDRICKTARSLNTDTSCNFVEEFAATQPKSWVLCPPWKMHSGAGDELPPSLEDVLHSGGCLIWD